jgi:hypothetical protein
MSYRPRSATGSEEPARDFLPGTDLRDSAVPARVEVDPQRLLQGVAGEFHGSIRGVDVDSLTLAT